MKLFMQSMSIKKIEKIISCKSNKKRKNDTSFITKMKYDQMSKNVMTWESKNVKMFWKYWRNAVIIFMRFILF